MQVTPRSQSTRRNEKKTKPDKEITSTEKMQNEAESEQVHQANATVASNAEQPSWVAELQANMQASTRVGLDAIQAKMEAGQHNMDAKLDKIDKQMEENLKGVREEMGQLREHVDKLGEELKQGLDGFREEANRKFEMVDVELRAQKKDIGILEERTVEAEEWSTEAQGILTAALEQQIRLQEKLTDLEGRSRRNNIRIWGLKEGLEGDSVSEYVDKLIHKELGMSDDVKLEIQRAHRALAPKSQPNKPPRAIIVNFLRFEVKENVLKTAWRTKVEVEGQRVNFDQDYSTEVAVKRRSYVGLKRILKERGIRFQSPMATLRVHWNDGIKIYNSAQDAARAMQQRGWTVPDQGEERPTLLQRMEAARKWTRVGRRERGEEVGMRVREDLYRFRSGHI